MANYEIIRQRLSRMLLDGIMTISEAKQFLLIPEGDAIAAQAFCVAHSKAWNARCKINETARKKDLSDALEQFAEEDPYEELE